MAIIEKPRGTIIEYKKLTVFITLNLLLPTPIDWIDDEKPWTKCRPSATKEKQ